MTSTARGAAAHLPDSQITPMQATQALRGNQFAADNQQRPDVYLAQASPDDAGQVFALMTPQICRNLIIEPITTIEQARDYVLGLQSAQKWRFSIRHQQHGLIGGLNFNLDGGYLSDPVEAVEVVGTKGEITAVFSYWLGEDYRRKGYGTMAVLQLLDALKGQGINHYLAQVLGRNTGSRKLLEKLGFRCDNSAITDIHDLSALWDYRRSDVHGLSTPPLKGNK